MDTFLDNQLIVPQYEFKVLTPDQPIMTKYSYSSKCSNDNTWTKGEKNCEDYSLGGYDCSDIGDDGRMAQKACLLSCDNCPDSVRIGKRLPSPVEDLKEPEWAVFEEYDSNGDTYSIDGYLPDSPVGYRELLARIDEMDDSTDLIGNTGSGTIEIDPTCVAIDETNEGNVAACGEVTELSAGVECLALNSEGEEICAYSPGETLALREYIQNEINDLDVEGDGGSDGSEWRAEVERLENLINELEGSSISAACPGYISGNAADPSTTCPLVICDLIPAVATVEEVTGVAEVIGSQEVPEACTEPNAEEMERLRDLGYRGLDPPDCSTFTGGGETCPVGCQYTARSDAVAAVDPVTAVSFTQGSAERCVPNAGVPATLNDPAILGMIDTIDTYMTAEFGVNPGCYKDLQECIHTNRDECEKCETSEVCDGTNDIKQYCGKKYGEQFDCADFTCARGTENKSSDINPVYTADLNQNICCECKGNRNWPFMSHAPYILWYMVGTIFLAHNLHMWADLSVTSSIFDKVLFGIGCFVALTCFIIPPFFYEELLGPVDSNGITCIEWSGLRSSVIYFLVFALLLCHGSYNIKNSTWFFLAALSCALMTGLIAYFVSMEFVHSRFFDPIDDCANFMNKNGCDIQNGCLWKSEEDKCEYDPEWSKGILTYLLEFFKDL